MSHIQEEFEKIELENGWNSLFRKLANDHGVRTLEKKTATALLSVNRGLNRFRDVLPYDDTRVRLQQSSNDYINANYVQVPWAKRNYILTQGPLSTTVDHFWQMIWEQNSRVIVMLTRLVEKGCNKCCLYYPDYETESELYFEDVDLKVTFVSERQEDHCIQRKFELTNRNESRLIIHWSDFDWPDHGAPATPESFLELLCDVRRSGAFDSRYGPPILHCSAGIGRSGTFVLVDSVLKMLAQANNPKDVSLIDVLAHIRTQRHGLIQTAEQLRFSYMAIVAGSRKLDELEQSEDLFNEYDFDATSESDNDDNDNLSTSLEDIKYELKKRSGSQLNDSHLQKTTTDTETSLRLREERLKRNEGIMKKVNKIKSKLDEESPTLSSSFLTNNNKTSILTLITKYRRHFFIGFFTLLTGSAFLYKFVRSNDQTH